MEFDWDNKKARANVAKHGVTFHEAASVFGDSLALTFQDPDHSASEDRLLTFGQSISGRLLVVIQHTGRPFESSALVRLHAENGRAMKKAKPRVEDIRAEYKRADLGAGVRGRFYEQYQKGHNLVLLKPEVAAVFPTDEAVNHALLTLVRIARASRRPTRRSSGRAAKGAARRST